MKRTTVSWLLRSVLILMLLALLTLLVVMIPAYMKHVTTVMPEISSWYALALAFSWIVAVPVFIALWLLWQIFGTVGEGNAFCHENAKRLRLICRLALADLVPVIGMVIFLLCNNVMPPFLIICFGGAIMIGLVAALVCFALSGLVVSAADMNDENKLTI